MENIGRMQGFEGSESLQEKNECQLVRNEPRERRLDKI